MRLNRHTAGSWCKMLIAVAALISSTTQAQPPDSDARGSAQMIASRVTAEVKYEQQLGQSIPPNLLFEDSTGEEVELDSLLSRRPAVLVLAYYRCPMLCTLVLNAAVDALTQISLMGGDDYSIVVISIDPRETPELAAQNMQVFVDRFNGHIDARGVHFLTGQKEAIDSVAKAIGFRYIYDPDSGQFAHPSGIVIMTPQRTVSKYFLGVQYAPGDVRLGLVEASQGRIGTLVDQVLLLCYQYDPTTGKYGLIITGVLRMSGMVTVLAIAGGVSLLLWRERRRHRQDRDDPSAGFEAAEGPVV